MTTANAFTHTHIYGKAITDGKLLPIINRNKTAIQNAYNTLKISKPNDLTPEKLAELNSLKGQLIKVGADKYYRINVSTRKNV